MFEPSRARGFGTRGSALVVVEDTRAAFASVLILQELGMAVDVVVRPEEAVQWLDNARYAVVVCGAAGGLPPELVALQVRYRAPQARVLVLAGATTPQDGLHELGVEVLRPPLSVNDLMTRLSPAA